MLQELAIENFAIIDRLVVRFNPGFTVLTGETGAGKSIIIDALHAVLGARVGADVVRDGAPSASVEAIFSSEVLDEIGLVSTLAEHGIEDRDCLILRRDIGASGRSSARVNGRAVPLSVLAAIGDGLVDIHGQTDHLSVLKRDRQLDILDRYGGLLTLRGDVSEAIGEYGRLQKELDALTSGQREAERQLDLLRFQVGEIESARVRPGEESELETERYLLANAERRTQLAETAFQRLHGETGSSLDALADVESAARDLAAIDPSLGAMHGRLLNAQVELDDIAQELRAYRDAVEFDPQRLNVVGERLDQLARLKRKYGPELNDILQFGARARADLNRVENLDEHISALRELVDRARQSAASTSEELSSKRSAISHDLTDAMGRALQGLGLNGTSFESSLTRAENPNGLPMSDGRRYAFSSTGIDSIAYLVSFNPGESLRPLERVASGGETSRFLLALKSVLAAADRTPTLVFDEVDVGVGGRHGTVVGERLRSLSQNHQVLSITHLPQVAALADYHLTVAKLVDGGRTGVSVRALEDADREAEIAEMMSGTGTETARQNARELLQAAQRRD